jgi:hypothetical protein
MGCRRRIDQVVAWPGTGSAVDAMVRRHPVVVAAAWQRLSCPGSPALL